MIKKFVDNLSLSVDETYRGNCPSCHGKNTFTARNMDGNILYNCYKNGCDVSGSFHCGMPALQIKQRLTNLKQKEDDLFSDALVTAFDMPPFISRMKPNTDKVNLFMRTWNINPDDVFYDIRQDRVVFPVYHNGTLVDAVGRSVFQRQPKWLRYAASPIPYMHGEGDIMVVVEDAISAYTVGEMFPHVVGVALLGTQLTEFHKWFFSKYYTYNNFIIALDHDAFVKTLKIIKELRPHVSNVRGLKLGDDLKYLRDNDVQSLKEMLNAC